MHLMTRKYNSIKKVEASLPKSFRDFAHQNFWGSATSPT